MEIKKKKKDRKKGRRKMNLEKAKPKYMFLKNQDLLIWQDL